MSDNLPASIPPAGITPHNLSPQIIEQLVANQARELDLRASDLALQQQKDTHAFTYAKEALTAQLEDRKDSRKHRCRMRDRLFIFVGCLVVIGVILIAYCLHSGHEAFALEILKFLIYSGLGSFGGYGYGRMRTPKTDDSSTSQPVA
jgi:hypothetical protein